METVQIEDLKWIGEHYSELQRKYPDMYIAVKDGKVIAVGRKFGEVYNKAKKIVDEKNFAIDYMLTGGVLGQAFIRFLEVPFRDDAIGSVRQVFQEDLGKSILYRVSRLLS